MGFFDKTETTPGGMREYWRSPYMTQYNDLMRSYIDRVGVLGSEYEQLRMTPEEQSAMEKLRRYGGRTPVEGTEEWQAAKRAGMYLADPDRLTDIASDPGLQARERYIDYQTGKGAEALERRFGVRGSRAAGMQGELYGQGVIAKGQAAGDVYGQRMAAMQNVMPMLANMPMMATQAAASTLGTMFQYGSLSRNIQAMNMQAEQARRNELAGMMQHVSTGGLTPSFYYQRPTTKTKKGWGKSAIGGLMAIGGIAAAPFTGGASLGLTSSGLSMLTGTPAADIQGGMQGMQGMFGQQNTQNRAGMYQDTMGRPSAGNLTIQPKTF